MTSQQQAPAKTWADSLRESLQGSFADEKTVNERLDYAARYCFLLSPATTYTTIPGCRVSFNLYWVDPDTEAHDVGGGKRSLLGTTLWKLSDAAGICWDDSASGRVDSGSHPHYVHWIRSGAHRALDGAVMSVHGHCQIDLRDGASQTQEVIDNVNEKNPEEKARKGRVQLQKMRAKILERAESGAQNRAIRKALKIRSYTKEELKQKPFVVVRLVFDGADADAEIERENKRRIASSMLGGSRALFGIPSAPRGVLPPAPPQAPALPPTIRQIVTDDGEILDGEVATGNTPVPGPLPTEPSAGEPPPPPGATVSTAQQAATPAPAPTTVATAGAPPPPPPPAPQASGGASGVTIPGGKEKGAPIESASDESLDYWLKRMEGDLPNKEPRFVASEERRIAAFRAEIERRRSRGPGGPMPQGW